LARFFESSLSVCRSQAVALPARSPPIACPAKIFAFEQVLSNTLRLSGVLGRRSIAHQNIFGNTLKFEVIYITTPPNPAAVMNDHPCWYGTLERLVGEPVGEDRR
jgi:hypothetical protein